MKYFENIDYFYKLKKNEERRRTETEGERERGREREREGERERGRASRDPWTTQGACGRSSVFVCGLVCGLEEGGELEVVVGAV